MAEPTHWVVRLTEGEKERRDMVASNRETTGPFIEALGRQINSDLRQYYSAFPNERNNIKFTSVPGESTIVRQRDEFSVYDGVLPSVRFWFERPSMQLSCRFTHRTGLDKTALRRNPTTYPKGQLSQRGGPWLA